MSVCLCVSTCVNKQIYSSIIPSVSYFLSNACVGYSNCEAQIAVVGKPVSVERKYIYTCKPDFKHPYRSGGKGKVMLHANL